jgi:hypothetical protein
MRAWIHVLCNALARRWNHSSAFGLVCQITFTKNILRMGVGKTARILCIPHGAITQDIFCPSVGNARYKRQDSGHRKLLKTNGSVTDPECLLMLMVLWEASLE